MAIAFTLEVAAPYSLCYLMASTVPETTILDSATLIAGARSAAQTYPGFSGSPLLEVLLTPVADDIEAHNLLVLGRTPPAGARTKHCWVTLTPNGGNQEWTILGSQDVPNGLAQLSITSGAAAGNAYLWIRRQHTLDQ
jgi:hypothetical protein